MTKRSETVRWPLVLSALAFGLALASPPVPADTAGLCGLRDIPESDPHSYPHKERGVSRSETPTASRPLGERRGFVELLAGEYNNNEQVWQQGLDGAPESVRRHWRFREDGDARLDLSIGQGQAAPDAPAWTFAFATERQGWVAEVSGASRCRYAWRKRPTGFEGEALDGGCAGLPRRMSVDEDWLEAVWPEGEAERARRVRHYRGWVALKRSHLDPEAADDDYVFVPDAGWHDEGCLLPVLDDGRPTGYAVELARLTYQNTRTSILKLGVIELATGDALSYAWAEPGADRIGINLRWIQAGLTRVAEPQQLASQNGGPPP